MRYSLRPIFYIATAVSLTTLGDSLIYVVLPSYYPHLGLLPFHVGILLSINRWIRLATNHTAEYCYRHFPKVQWLLFALLTGAIVTVVYGIAWAFIIFLVARIFWGISYSFLRQAAVMTAIQSGPETHLAGQRVGFYRSIDAIWRISGILLGGISHDLLGFTATFISFGILSLVATPIGFLSQKELKGLKTPSFINIHGRTDPRIIFCGFTIGLVGGGMIISTLGLILKENFGESIRIIGLPIGVVTFTGIMIGVRYFIDGMSPIWGTIGDRISRRRSISLLYITGATSLMILSTQANPILLLMLILIFFICGTTLHILLLVQAGLQGTRSVASFVTAIDLGMSVGPLLAWTIAQLKIHTNYIFFVGGMIYIAGAVTSFFIPKRFAPAIPQRDQICND